MSFFRPFLFSGLLAIALGPAVFAVGSQQNAEEPALSWATDLPSALTQARQENKLILLNFTGSDWCYWCHRLRDEVLVKKPFLAYANAQLIGVEVDFPKQKKLPGALAEQNRMLQEKYGVTGYPTIILIDPEGRELGRMGYIQGGAKTFVRALREFARDKTAAPHAGP